ncbi:MAG: nucleotide exchange factor GrpE [Candidatus Symbiothrix sp.]|jgi:molecular chaperone GrpE|nr:nucleotide exchange factor GrpE [Candidatus Symbiothrix sp.]
MSKKEFNNTQEQNANLADELTKEKAFEEMFDDNVDDGSAESIELHDTDDVDSETTDDATDELAETKDAYVRLMAEYDNFRKRTIKEKADLIKNGGEKTLVGLLPIVDDFERALENVDTATDLVAVKEGVDLIYQKFISFLQQNGVKAMETVGQEFDPEWHEAVALVPETDDDKKGKVIDNLQTGYTLNDKVIRHAKVAVANG